MNAESRRTMIIESDDVKLITVSRSTLSRTMRDFLGGMVSAVATRGAVVSRARLLGRTVSMEMLSAIKLSGRASTRLDANGSSPSRPKAGKSAETNSSRMIYNIDVLNVRLWQ